MSYSKSRPGNGAILIARSGYSGFGDSTTDYLSQVPNPPAPQQNAATPSTIDRVGSFLGGLLTGAVKSYATAAGTKPAQTTIVQSSTPSWAIPAAIGGVGLLAVVLLTRK